MEFIIAAFIVLIIWGIFLGGFDRVITKAKDKRSPIVTLHPSDYEWGNGKDLSELHPDFSIAALSPDYPELLAQTTLAQLEKQWMEEHPTELQVQKALWEKQLELATDQALRADQLAKGKSALIADQRKEIAELRAQVKAYVQMVNPPFLPGGLTSSHTRYSDESGF
jgi:hypothetical protein